MKAGADLSRRGSMDFCATDAPSAIRGPTAQCSRSPRRTPALRCRPLANARGRSKWPDSLRISPRAAGWRGNHRRCSPHRTEGVRNDVGYQARHSAPEAKPARATSCTTRCPGQSRRIAPAPHGPPTGLTRSAPAPLLSKRCRRAFAAVSADRLADEATPDSQREPHRQQHDTREPDGRP